MVWFLQDIHHTYLISNFHQISAKKTLNSLWHKNRPGKHNGQLTHWDSHISYSTSYFANKKPKENIIGGCEEKLHSNSNQSQLSTFTICGRGVEHIMSNWAIGTSTSEPSRLPLLRPHLLIPHSNDNHNLVFPHKIFGNALVTFWLARHYLIICRSYSSIKLFWMVIRIKHSLVFRTYIYV